MTTASNAGRKPKKTSVKSRSAAVLKELEAAIESVGVESTTRAVKKLTGEVSRLSSELAELKTRLEKKERREVLPASLPMRSSTDCAELRKVPRKIQAFVVSEFPSAKATAGDSGWVSLTVVDSRFSRMDPLERTQFFQNSSKSSPTINSCDSWN